MGTEISLSFTLILLINFILNSVGFKIGCVLLLCLITSISEAQTYCLKGKITDESNAIAGASVILNGKYVTQSGMNGDFNALAKVGDTLKINSRFYKDLTKVLNDTLKLTLVLRQKEFQLNEVNISFNKRKVIDSMLVMAFASLNKEKHSGKGFLRQSIVKNNSEIVLANEGLVHFTSPGNKELSSHDNHYKKIGINIQSSCSLTPLTEKKLIFSINPQISFRRGIAPEYYYKIIKSDIINEFFKEDSSKIIINITAHLKKPNKKVNYICTINKDSNSLKQIQRYEEDANGDYFFTNFEYKNNNVISIYSNAKQNRLNSFYSTTEEIFINPSSEAFHYPINFNSNKCGLHLYLNETVDCEAIKEYKKFNSIPEQRYF